MSKVDWSELTVLATQAMAGDKGAYARFLAQISTLLKPRFARSLSAACVEDALQETLMAIHKSLHTLDVTKSVAAWIYAIAHYKIQDQLRIIYKNANLEEFDERAFKNEVPFTSFQDVDLEEMLKALNAKELAVLKLLKVEEYSVSEIAVELKMTPSNVKVTAFRAIRKLRESAVKEDFHENG